MTRQPWWVARAVLMLALLLEGCATAGPSPPAASVVAERDPRPTGGYDAARGELRRVRAELARIDLSASHVTTRGWDHLADTEWPFFTAVFFAHAACQLAETAGEGVGRAELQAETRWALDLLRTPRLAGFAPRSGASPALLVDGHLFFLLERCRSATASAAYDALRDQLSRAFSSAYAGVEGLLPSYPNMWLPGDNAPAIAALKLHAQAAGEAEPPAVMRFTALLREHARDPVTGLVCAYYDPIRRRPIGPPRGSSVLLAMPFLRVAAPAIADDQMRLVRTHLMGQLLGLTGIREFLRGVVADADVDSGRIVEGIGESASGFGLVAAAAVGDRTLYEDLARSMARVVPLRWEGDQLRAVGLPPVGQAALLFGKTYPL